MLADPEWLLPLVAAQRQFRSSYYGLTAAALLEDVWFDALANWLHRAEPGRSVRKPTRGANSEAGDYVFEDLPFGHKNGNGPGTIGVHWDAVAAADREGEPWVSDVPMVFLSAGYGGLTGRWTPEGSTRTFSCRATWRQPTNRPASMVVALVVWSADGTAVVAKTWEEWPAFEALWPAVTMYAGAFPLNHIDLLWMPRGHTHEGDRGVISWTTRPGVYIFASEVLRAGVPAGGNNRATTLSRQTVIGLMQQAVATGLWAPLPMWYANYAPPRPPDLYLPIRAQFDSRFSQLAWVAEPAPRDPTITSPA